MNAFQACRRRRRSSRYAGASSIDLAARLATVVLAVLSLIGIALTSVGFGVALALNAMFGPDLLEIFSGPLDYLAASAWVIVSIFNSLAEQWSDPRKWARLVAKAMAMFVLVALIAAIAALAHTHWEKASRVARLAIEPTRRAIGWVRRERWLWRVPAVLAIAVAAAAVPLLLTRALLFVFALALGPFIVGLLAAEEHFHAAVIEPVRCASSLSAQDRRDRSAGKQPTPRGRPYGATCVEVKSKEVGVGSHRARRIIATGESIALFSPDSGRVVVVPRKDAIVTFVDEL